MRLSGISGWREKMQKTWNKQYSGKMVEKLCITKRSIASTSVYIKSLINAYVKYTKSKCKFNKGQKELNELNNALERTQFCVAEYIKNNVILLISPADLKEKIVECSEDFIKASENCLPENEKYYPKFSQDIISGLVDLIFKYKQNFTTSGWNSEVQLCFQNFKYHSNREKMLECFKGDLLQDGEEYTKQYVCDRLSEASKCITQEIKSICVEDVAVNEFREEFEKVFTRPCGNVKDED